MKWRAGAFNVPLSSARQRLTPLFSNYFLWILEGEKGRGGGNPITPRSARLLVPREGRCCMSAPTSMLQPSSSGRAVHGLCHGQSHRRKDGRRKRDTGKTRAK